MAWPTTFANLAAGNQPLSLLDGMFNQVASMIMIPTTVVGQNSLTLSPIGNAPTLAAYASFNNFRFVAISTNNAPLSAQYTTLPNLPVYMADRATQVPANTVLSGQEYVLVFDAALNGGNGGFVLESAAVPLTSAAAGGSFSGLRIANNAGTPDSRVDISCNEVVMVSGGGSVIRATNVAVTVNMLVNGANGLDTGAFTAGGFYFLYLISNGSTTAGLASRSSTAPTLPGGYTFVKRVGSAPMDLSNAATSGVTITNANPGVVTWTAHGQVAGAPVVFTAGGGVLPGSIIGGTQYYVSPTGLTANTFQVTTAPLGNSINTAGGSGTVTGTSQPVRFKRFIQYGPRTQYVVAGAGTGGTQLPIIAQGNTSALGVYSTTAPTWAAIPVIWVPATAFQIDLIGSMNSIAGSGGPYQIAPNNNYGGIATTNGNVPWFDTFSTTPTFNELLHHGLMTLESANIYWAASTAAITLWVGGYVDNL